MFDVAISANANNQPRSSRRIFNPPQDDKLNNRKIPNRLLAQTRDDKLSCRLVLLILILSASIARAECVPQPNCASIGYTETSCETQAVKCPFDSSKLYCLPCDSKYQYSCSGVGETGEGNGCKGKYESCTCADNYVSFCDVIFCN